MRRLLKGRTTFRSDHPGEFLLNVSRSTEIRVGLVSLVSIAVLIGGIMIGKGISFSPNKRTISIRLATSGGVETGSPIVVNGVKRGSVADVSGNNGSVLIHADIDDASDLKTDATATVTILEITGGKKIEINPGKAAGTFDVNTEMPGTVAADIGGLVTSLGEVSGSAVDLVRRLDTISASLTELLRDGSFVTNVKTISSDGALLVTDVRTWFSQNRAPLTASIRDLREISTTLRESVDRNEPKVSQIIDRADKVLLNLETTLAKADGAIIGADTLIARINGVVNDIRTNKSLVNMLLYDEKMAARLDSTLANLRVLLRDFGKNGINVNVELGHVP
ncbi:MAG: MCE family protein [Ignavibacteria bacterium]|nr:MCE family protein [Ignavibacteria bacterium]MBP6509341.1 MCE family protein [Candidatus Kapabacteria bacterium]MBK6419542.1 MCE family protein [Ignavibacteria bacterium]MBK6759835.1 MCE family protein [Ignavibacteria bacterium]MBK7184717.1 MCE family protein [Ignavibacteria bacterium]